MSKRFGRNRRRAAREALAQKEAVIGDLNIAIEMDRGLLRENTRLMLNLERRLKSIAIEVGDCCTLNDIPHELSFANKHDMRIPAERRTNFEIFDISQPLVQEKIYVEVMRLLEIDVVFTELNRNMHCYVEIDNQRVGYSLSQTAIARIREDRLEHMMLREVAPALVKLLVQKLREKL